MEKENESGRISWDNHHLHIKIKPLQWGAPTEIHNALYEVHGYDAVDHSTVLEEFSFL